MMMPLWPKDRSIGKKRVATVSSCQADFPLDKGGGSLKRQATTKSPVHLVVSKNPRWTGNSSPRPPFRTTIRFEALFAENVATAKAGVPAEA